VSKTDGGNGYSLCGRRTYTVSPSEYLWFDDPVSFLSTLYLSGSYPEFYTEFIIANDGTSETKNLTATLQVGLEEYPDMPT